MSRVELQFASPKKKRKDISERKVETEFEKTKYTLYPWPFLTTMYICKIGPCGKIYEIYIEYINLVR